MLPLLLSDPADFKLLHSTSLSIFPEPAIRMSFLTSPPEMRVEPAADNDFSVIVFTPEVYIFEAS